MLSRYEDPEAGPATLVAGPTLGAMPEVLEATLDAEFTAFFAANHGRLVSRLRMLGGGAAADDLAQDAMVLARSHWPTIRHYDVPAAWLFKVATRALWKFQAAERGSGALSIDVVEQEVNDPRNHESTVIDRIDVSRAIEKLPMRQRDVAFLYYINDLPMPEIAETLGISEGTVKATAHAARKRVRELLESVEKRPDPGASEQFIRSLNDLYRRCGRPSLRELSHTSERLRRGYGEQARDLPRLSSSTMSDVLNGRRARLPQWNWVAAFVLSCERYAYKVGRRTDAPGDDVLREWRRLHNEAFAPRAERDAAGERKVSERYSGDVSRIPSTDPPSDPSAPSEPVTLAAFTQRLRDLRAACGRPSLREISRTSARLDRPSLPALSVTSISDVLNGRRTGPPTWPWVAAFVLSCQTLGFRVGARAAPPGDVLAWQDLLLAVTPQSGSGDEGRMLTRYGEHGRELLRAAERDDDPDACYRLGVLLRLDGRSEESWNWLMRATVRGHRDAAKLIERDDLVLPPQTAE